MHEADLTIVLLHQRPVSLLIKVHAERTLEVAEFHNGNGGVLGTNIRIIAHAHINSALIRLDLALRAGHALNPGHPASQSKTASECIAEGEVTDAQTDQEAGQTSDSNKEPRSLNHDDVLIVGRFGSRRHVVDCSRFTAARNVLVCE